jgi:hypothetical protein
MSELNLPEYAPGCHRGLDPNRDMRCARYRSNMYYSSERSLNLPFK